MQMFRSISNSLSGSGFALILFLLLAIGLIYFRLIHPRLNRINYQGGKELLSIHLLDRFVGSCIVILLAVSFILVNPPLHALIVLFLILIFFETLLNFSAGCNLIFEARLREGMEVEIGHSEGVLKNLKWTGLTVSEGRKSEFLPYRKVLREGVSVVQGNIPQIVTLLCSRKDDLEVQQAQALLQGKLFSFPFVINGSKPTYLIEEKDIKVSLALTSSNFISSLREMLQQAGFTVEILNA